MNTALLVVGIIVFLAFVFVAGYAGSISAYLNEYDRMHPTHRWVIGAGWVCREHGSDCFRCWR